MMSKHKANPKDKEKGGQLVIRVDKADRAAFIAQCKKLDTTAAREIRRFMREFIAPSAPEGAAKADVLAEGTFDAPALPPEAVATSTPAQVATEMVLGGADTPAPIKTVRKPVKL